MQGVPQGPETFGFSCSSLGGLKNGHFPEAGDLKWTHGRTSDRKCYCLWLKFWTRWMLFLAKFMERYFISDRSKMHVEGCPGLAAGWKPHRLWKHHHASPSNQSWFESVEITEICNGFMSLWHFWTICSPSSLHRGSVSFKKNVHGISQVGFFIATDKWQDQATKIHTSSTPYGTIQAFQQSSLLLLCGQKKYSTEGRWLSSKHIFPNVSQGWILTVYIFLYVNESTGFCPSTMC